MEHVMRSVGQHNMEYNKNEVLKVCKKLDAKEQEMMSINKNYKTSRISLKKQLTEKEKGSE